MVTHTTPFTQTITFDNGSEFTSHEVIVQQLNADIYFARPDRAYERVRNENANGLIRQYIPKGMSFESIIPEQLQEIVKQLNVRARRKHRYRNTIEIHEKKAPVDKGREVSIMVILR